jgi:hypothetical protein
MRCKQQGALAADNKTPGQTAQGRQAGGRQEEGNSSIKSETSSSDPAPIEPSSSILEGTGSL